MRSAPSRSANACTGTGEHGAGRSRRTPSSIRPRSPRRRDNQLPASKTVRRQGVGSPSDVEVGLRLRRRLQGHAGAARGQGRERRRDDQGARPRPRPGRIHDHDRGVRRVHARQPHRARGDGRPGRRGARAAGAAGGQALGRGRRPAARVGQVGSARVDAGDARHGSEPRAQRRVGAGLARTTGQRPVCLGLLPALRADVRKRLPRDRGRALRGRDRGGEERARSRAGH